MKKFFKFSMIVVAFGLLFTNCSKSVESVSLDQTTLTLRIGTTAKLVPIINPEKAKDQSVTWSSSDATVASVADGTVTALAAGQATITVTTVDGNKTATCKVTVEYGYIENDYGIVLVPVEGGTFTMGADDSDSESSRSEKPAHSVTLTSFNMMKYEVTQKQWYDIMGKWPIPQLEPTTALGKGDNYPAYNISWDEIQAFIDTLNQKTGKSYRLPTEAEWEFAARGGIHSQGYKYGGSNIVGDVAWYNANAQSKTNPVGGKQPNEIGLYDMSGNVDEWCNDWSYSYAADAQTNPTGPSQGEYKIVRGGSWNTVAKNCRVVYRDQGLRPNTHSGYLGLRLVHP
jgi:formylglycine-generating enzyme required for sulfatase activity